MDKKIKIYGERNTGTNYLTKLVELNYDVEILPGTVPVNINRFFNKIPKSEFLRDTYFKYNKNHLGWKHRELDNSFIEQLKSIQPNIQFISITKNPYSWLLSLYNRPYHYFKNKEKMSFSEFLQTKWMTVGRETTDEMYVNPIVMWNKKNQSYLDLESNFNVVLIKYEDLLKDPLSELKKIGEKTNLKTSGLFPTNFTKSTKDKEKNNNYYKDYYGMEKWKEKLSKENIKIINKYLDDNLMNIFEYKQL